MHWGLFLDFLGALKTWHPSRHHFIERKYPQKNRFLFPPNKAQFLRAFQQLLCWQCFVASFAEVFFPHQAENSKAEVDTLPGSAALRCSSLSLPRSCSESSSGNLFALFQGDSDPYQKLCLCSHFLQSPHGTTSTVQKCPLSILNQTLNPNSSYKFQLSALVVQSSRNNSSQLNPPPPWYCSIFALLGKSFLKHQILIQYRL